MFSNVGWGEVIVLAVIALFVFGPERLPGLSKEAASGLKKARQAVRGVREQVNDSLGDDLAHLRDLDLRQYHPRTFIRNQLLAEDDELVPPRRSGATASRVEAARARDRATPPPFDADAT